MAFNYLSKLCLDRASSGKIVAKNALDISLKIANLLDDKGDITLNELEQIAANLSLDGDKIDALRVLEMVISQKCKSIENISQRTLLYRKYIDITTTLASLLNTSDRQYSAPKLNAMLSDLRAAHTPPNEG